MNPVDGQRKTKCSLALTIAINKCSNTYYGKGFLRDKRYDNPGHGFQVSESNFYKGGQSGPQGGARAFYTTSQHFGNKKAYDNDANVPVKVLESREEVIDDSPHKEELMATLKQTKYKISKTGKKTIELDDDDAMNGISKGITTNKQERDRIPIKTMFGNDEDLVDKHNSRFRFDEEQGDNDPGRRKGRNLATPQQSARRDQYLEDERSKLRDNLNAVRVGDKGHQPVIKVNSQKHSRQGLNTAGAKINFQTSLSPDFLNLFAH